MTELRRDERPGVDSAAILAAIGERGAAFTLKDLDAGRHEGLEGVALFSFVDDSLISVVAGGLAEIEAEDWSLESVPPLLGLSTLADCSRERVP